MFDLEALLCTLGQDSEPSNFSWIHSRKISGSALQFFSLLLAIVAFVLLQCLFLCSWSHMCCKVSQAGKKLSGINIDLHRPQWQHPCREAEEEQELKAGPGSLWFICSICWGFGDSHWPSCWCHLAGRGLAVPAVALVWFCGSDALGHNTYLWFFMQPPVKVAAPEAELGLCLCRLLRLPFPHPLCLPSGISSSVASSSFCLRLHTSLEKHSQGMSWLFSWTWILGSIYMCNFLSLFCTDSVF